MGEIGIIGPDERVELLNGELLQMPPIGPSHAEAVDTLHSLLRDLPGDRAKAYAQRPITLNDESEPQPDVVVVRLPATRYRSAHPVPGDVVLIAEVSDATLHYDRTEKLQAYACAGIAEYWIVNLQRRVVERYRDPAGPRYRSHEIVRPGTTIATAAFPDDGVPVHAIFGIETERT